MLGRPCKWDGNFTCFKLIECEATSLTECLKSSIIFLMRENERLKHRQMQKHSDASKKWRNQAFYFKKKVRQLELWLMSKGVKVPNSDELSGMKELEEAPDEEK